MRKVNIHEAKSTLSQLIESAEAGEVVVIARAGKPVVELRSLPPRPPVRLGLLKGKLPEKLLAGATKPLPKAVLRRFYSSRLIP